MSSTRALAPRLIGRQTQLRELDEHLQLARGGAGRLVFLAGEAGVGKTRLLREFTDRIHTTGGSAIMAGHCYEEGPAAPYGVFVDALQSFVREHGPQALTQPAGPWAADLALLLPELEPLVTASRPVTDPQVEKRRLFEAIARVLRPRGAQSCQVLILEDLHWADQSSQELVAYLARAVEHDPVLILATYRSDELHRRHPLTHLLAQLSRERRHSEIRLPPLAHEELARMLEATLERPLPGTFVDVLYDRTEGNPFFAEEILKALIASGRLAALIEQAQQGRSVDRLDIPLSLKDSILSRTADLDPITAEVLRYAAVIGRGFDFELLLRLTGLNEAELLRVVERLIERQLVVEERDTEDHYRFRHALTREVIYDDLLGRDQRLKHQAILRAVEQLHAGNLDAVADQLAYHSRQAKDLANLARFARLAGDQALRRRGYREAQAYYETALELIETDDPREKAILLEQLADAVWPLPDLETWSRYAREAQQLYAQLGDRRKVAVLDYWLGVRAWDDNDLETAFAHTRAAVAALEAEAPGPDLAAAYGMVARLYMLTNRPRESIPWSEKALRIAETLGDTDTQANALNSLGISLVVLGDVQRGIADLERSLELAKGSGFGRGFTVSRAYVNLSFCLATLGEFKRAAQVLYEGVTVMADAHSFAQMELAVLGEVELALGEWTQAEETLERAFRVGDMAVPIVRAVAVPIRCELLLRQGRLEEARQLESYLSECERTGFFEVFGMLLASLARVYLALGDPARAIELADRCVAAWRNTGSLSHNDTTLARCITVYLVTGRDEQTPELLDALGALAQRTGSSLTLAHLADAQGLIAAHEGRHADAAEHFREAAIRWRAMAAPFEEAIARRRLAESLLVAGDPSARDEARHELAAARATFERLGAPLELAAADAVTARHDLVARPAKAGRVGELTPRERQVIALIARGYSNRQIAEALTISEKTAEIHVSNILGKLGFSSRAQAAAYAVKRGLAAAHDEQSLVQE